MFWDITKLGKWQRIMKFSHKCQNDSLTSNENTFPLSAVPPASCSSSVLFCFRSSMEQWRWPGFWSQADWADHVISLSCSLFVNMRYLYLSYIKSRWFWILMIVKRREDSEAGNQTHTLSKPSRRRWWAVRLRHLFDFYVLLFPRASVTSFSLDRYRW